MKFGARARGCSGCDARQETIQILREEMEHLRTEKQLAVDRLMATLGKFEATAAALVNVVDDEPAGPHTEAEALEAEEAEQVRIDEEAEKELNKYAENRNVPVDALRDL